MWKIHYADGSTFSSEDGPPEQAPRDEVQAIVDRFPDGTRRIHHGSDYYLWLGENWASGNLADLERWLHKALPGLKFGGWMNDSEYQAVVDQAMEEPCDGC